nr:hypothetical protein 6 [bacterium]
MKETKTLIIRLPKEMHKKLKGLSIATKKPMTQIVLNNFQETLLKDHGKKVFKYSDGGAK